MSHSDALGSSSSLSTSEAMPLSLGNGGTPPTFGDQQFTNDSNSGGFVREMGSIFCSQKGFFSLQFRFKNANKKHLKNQDVHFTHEKCCPVVGAYDFQQHPLRWFQAKKWTKNTLKLQTNTTWGESKSPFLCKMSAFRGMFRFSSAIFQRSGLRSIYKPCIKILLCPS